MRKIFLALAIAGAMATPAAFAMGGGHGGGHGGMGMGGGMQQLNGMHNDMDMHGDMVSGTAASARANDLDVGTSVRDTARDQSQGSAHANSHASAAVNDHGKASANSELGTETATPIMHKGHHASKTHATHVSSRRIHARGSVKASAKADAAIPRHGKAATHSEVTAGT